MSGFQVSTALQTGKPFEILVNSGKQNLKKHWFRFRYRSKIVYLKFVPTQGLLILRRLLVSWLLLSRAFFFNMYRCKIPCVSVRVDSFLESRDVFPTLSSFCSFPACIGFKIKTFPFFRSHRMLYFKWAKPWNLGLRPNPLKFKSITIRAHFL